MITLDINYLQYPFVFVEHKHRILFFHDLLFPLACVKLIFTSIHIANMSTDKQSLVDPEWKSNVYDF